MILLKDTVHAVRVAILTETLAGSRACRCVLTGKSYRAVCRQNANCQGSFKKYFYFEIKNFQVSNSLTDGPIFVNLLKQACCM